MDKFCLDIQGRNLNMLQVSQREYKFYPKLFEIKRKIQVPEK